MEDIFGIDQNGAGKFIISLFSNVFKCTYM